MGAPIVQNVFQKLTQVIYLDRVLKIVGVIVFVITYLNSWLSRDTRAYTSSEPCEVSILAAACGYAAFNLARCTSACHCRYGYSCNDYHWLKEFQP